MITTNAPIERCTVTNNSLSKLEQQSQKDNDNEINDY